jgi:hypothetical protein
MRALDCVVPIAEESFDLDKAEYECLDRFLVFARGGISSKEARRLKLKKEDPRSIADYFHGLELKGDDLVKYYKLNHDSTGLSVEEIEEKAKKLKLRYPSLFV